MKLKATLFSLVGAIVLMGLMAFMLHVQSSEIAAMTQQNKQLNNDLTEQIEINKDYKSRIQSLHLLDTQHTQELTNAKAEIDKLRDDVKSGVKRVYVKAECPKVGADTAESGRNESTAQLSEATEQDYWRLREMMAENEQQTLYLQNYINTQCLAK